MAGEAKLGELRGPDCREACVGDNHGGLRQALREFRREPLGPDGGCEARRDGSSAVTPATERVGAPPEPGGPVRNGAAGGRELLQHAGRTANEAECVGVVAAEFRRVDVDLQDAGPDARVAPVAGDLVADVAARVNDEVSLIERLVGVGRRIGAESAEVLGVRRLDQAASADRSGHRNGERVRESPHGVADPGLARPDAQHEHGALSGGYDGGCLGDVGASRFRGGRRGMVEELPVDVLGQRQAGGLDVGAR